MVKNQIITAKWDVMATTPLGPDGASQIRLKLAGKPGSVVGSHSSGPRIAARLKPPTRKLGGSRHRLPIRCCSGWRLPRFTPAAYTAGLVSVALFLASRRTGVTRHPTLWSPDFPL